LQPLHDVSGEEDSATVFLVPRRRVVDLIEDHDVRGVQRITMREPEYGDELVAEDLEVDRGQGGRHGLWPREYLHEDDFSVYPCERELARG